MNIDETREVRRLLKHATDTDDDCRYLAMQATQFLGGYPVSISDIRKAWKRVDDVLADSGGQGTFKAEFGRTAHLTARFNTPGLPREQITGFFSLATDACEAELPAWLLNKGRQAVAAKSPTRTPAMLRKADRETRTAAWAPIVKAEKQTDGTLLVYGKVSDDAIDNDGQICDAKWLKTAVPEWYRTAGNIREQHSSLAAGKAVSYEEKPDGHYITALVVDPTSVAKVEARVLQGFSIGIKRPRVVADAKARGGRVVDGRIVEVSLVDRPANPACTLSIAKSDAAGQALHIEQQFIDNRISEPDSGEVARLRKRADDSSDPDLRAGYLVRAEKLEKSQGRQAPRAHLDRVVHLRKMADGASDPQLRNGFTQLADNLEKGIA
jgi:hypothetical protein